MTLLVLIHINDRLRYLKKPLEEAREKVRLLEEDERTLEWIHKVEDARRQRIERMAGDLEPRGQVRWMLTRLFGVKPPDMVRYIAGILLEPVAEELEDLQKRLAGARREFSHLDAEQRTLTSRKHEITRARERYEELLYGEGEETFRRFEAPGRVRTALVRMVDDVFATRKRQEDAGEAGDFEEVWRLMEVEKAYRAQLHGLWRIDPMRRGQGAWTAVTKEKRVEGGYGAALPAIHAELATRKRLKEARVRGCPSEIQRLEDEERLLDRRVKDIGGCVISTRFRPAGYLPAPRDGVARQQRMAA